jgi:carbon monoxide dehydrogenase subunit G
MKVSGSYVIPAPPERTYAILQDPIVLARCMPGTERLNRIGDDHYEMKMKMVVAAISGSFEGTVRLADQSPPESFRLIVEGAGKIGFVKGEGLLKLSVNGGGSTQVSYDGDVHIGGSIAGVGQRLLDATSKMILKKFFTKLTAEVGKAPSPTTTSSEAPTPTEDAASGSVG